MRESMILRMQMRNSIRQELTQRTESHQQAVRRMHIGIAALNAAGAAPATSPLVMLAHGDSWFDYPLSGNGLSFHNTDIVSHLMSLGTMNPMILNVSHFGDATTEEMSWPKQQRMIDALQDPRNWMSSGKPDAILFSGGGDDIAGNQFCIFLDYAIPGASGLNAARFRGALNGVQASYLDLFAFRDRYAPGVPIFGHCYDFPVPNGIHPSCGGPWLQPSLQFSGWNLAQGTSIVRQALIDFKSMLMALESDARNNFTLVDTQGLLNPGDWANELHPFPNGFQALAKRFVDVLRQRFPGRI